MHQQLPSIQSFLRNTCVVPVYMCAVRAVPNSCVRDESIVPLIAAWLDDRYRDFGIFRKTIGHHKTCGTCTNNYVVEMLPQNKRWKAKGEINSTHDE